MRTALLEKAKKSILSEQFSMANWCTCVAAHVIHARHGVWPVFSTSDTGHTAAAYLGISPEEATRLFYLSNWPRKFVLGVGDVSPSWTNKENVIKRIDHFIATDGTDKLPRKRKPKVTLRAA